MNVPLVARVVASLVAIIGAVMLTAVPIGYLMNDSPLAVYRTMGCSLFVMLCGLLVIRLTRDCQGRFGFREGFGIVTFGWLFASIFGALPFTVVCDFYFYDSFFETISGFTTTGASVIDNALVLRDGTRLPNGLADIPYCALYWRSMTHWLGGMGIVVLSLAILPSLGISAHQLYKAEAPGPIDSQITPKIADSAKILWGVYVLFSIVETILLRFGGMSLFDSWCHTCGTMATGGFSTRQASLAFYAQPGYHAAYIDWIITIFMFLAGANFVLHFRALRGKPLTYFKDEEFLFYLLVTLACVLTITFMLMGGDLTTSAGAKLSHVDFLTAIRYAAFQVVSMMTTTGFATADFNIWPAYCVLILIAVMFLGGCGGSTAGGIKHARIVLLLKYAVTQIERCLFRRAISNVQLNRHRVSPATLHKTLTFFFIFLGLFAFFSLALTLIGVNTPGETRDGVTLASGDVLTAATASIATLGNVGPGLNKVGPVYSYSWMKPPAKLLLCLAMLLGRLELFTVLVIFLPAFWKR